MNAVHGAFGAGGVCGDRRRSRQEQARFDAYGEIEHDDFDDLEDDLFDDDFDAPSRGSSALTGAGGTFLRVVVGFLALWCWRIAPTGCAWGVIVAGKLVRSPIFGSPFQWFATSFVVSSVSCVALLALTRKKFGTAMNQPRRSDGGWHADRQPYRQICTELSPASTRAAGAPTARRRDARDRVRPRSTSRLRRSVGETRVGATVRARMDTEPQWLAIGESTRWIFRV